MSSNNDNDDQQQDETFLFCDALPISTTIDLNLVACLTGQSLDYSGTSTISFQVEAPTTCLFLHFMSSRMTIDKLQLHQGKHVLRPKCVYDMENFVILPSTNSSAATTTTITNSSTTTSSTTKSSSSSSSSSSPPFDFIDKKTRTHVNLGDPSKMLSNLSVQDLKIIELPSAVSYCTIDIVISFQSRLSNDGNGIYMCASRPKDTIANSLELRAPTFFVATQFEVDHAHKSFPCVDFVFIRQTVKFVLTVPVNAYCRSNGGGGGIEELDMTTSSGTQCVFARNSSSGNNNNNKSTFLTKKESLPASIRPIPFYIAGFIASTVPLIAMCETVTLPALVDHGDNNNNDNDDVDDHDKKNQQQQGTSSSSSSLQDVPEETVEFCILTTYDSQFMTELALKTVIDATREIRQFFHCPYELPHLWVLAAPKLVLGGMENDGFIFLKESLGVSNQSQPGQGRRSVEAATKELVRFIVHEVVHHWIGNRVGFSFAWKEGITLVLERYYGNVLLGLNPNQGSKGGASTTESESAASESGKLVEVDSGKELSGTTYHKAESAMEAVVRKLGWKAFQNGVQRMIHEMNVGDYVDDKSISSFFKLNRKQKK